MKPKQVIFPSMCLSILFLFASCRMFTTSLAKGMQRNQMDALKNASATELLAFAQGPHASSSQTTRAVLNLLSEKTPAELSALSLQEKETALKLTLDATVPTDKIGELAEKAASLGSNTTPEQGEKLAKEMLQKTEPFNTKAAVTLLSDPAAMKNGDPAVLAAAAAAVMTQVVAQTGYDKMKENINTGGSGSIDLKTTDADTIVNKMLGSSPAGTSENKAALKAAVNVAKLLSGAAAKDSSGTEVTRNLKPEDVKLLGLLPLSNILNGF